jgi:nucleoside phosphorylase/tetratricopeptide (TPR) repeat protein
MGKVNAAGAVASMRSSYTALRLVLLAGICGGVPYNRQKEILLGDVVISKTVIQYDFGRQYPDKFVLKDTVEVNLSKHDKNIRNFLAIFNTDGGRDELQKKTAHFLKQLQAKAGHHAGKYIYPGGAEDKLFERSYRHKHRISPTCICRDCHGRFDPVCDKALDSSCGDLGCDERYLVARKRLVEQDQQANTQEPAIHIGAVASGDTVMKSGEDRDRIAEKEGIIAFEMEGAGIWEEVPSIVVKGVCDYADCHKNKRWQDFAAATAAAASKAILERYIQVDRSCGRFAEVPSPIHFLVPFGRNQSFVGRKTILSKLQGRIWPDTNKDDCQRTTVEGLGGVGKTQIALEAVYLVHNEHPDCSVFWVPAVDATSFENAYREIGKQMKLEGIDEEKADVKRLVKTALEKQSNGNWLLVVDNADDVALLFGDARLSDYLPFSRKGSILFTTRNHKVAVQLESNIVEVAEMDDGEALDMLQTGLEESQTSDVKSTKRLLDLLANLPLAIRQASAYMAENQLLTSEYLQLCESKREDMIDLLSRDFDDRHRYKETRNPVATTWLVSFSHVSQRDRLAAEYLKFMSLMAEKDIPKSLLPTARKMEAVEAIGTLKAYAFISQREGQDSFDMHRLVRLAMQNWLEKKGELKQCVTSAIRRLSEAFPFPEHENRELWTKYLPHAHTAVQFGESSTSEAAESQLLLNIGESYRITGNYQEAEQIYWRDLKLRKKVLGKDHPDTLFCMNKLAEVLRQRGKYKDAKKMHQRALEKREEVLGREHADTLRSKNNLALVLHEQGMYAEAEHMLRQTLDLEQKVLGKEHRYTLDSLNNLAATLQCQGKYKEAEQMHRQERKLMEKLLGPEHPDTLISMNNLATVLKGLGKYKEAEQMHRQTLELRGKVLGKEHPDTLRSKNNLAIVLMSLGKYVESEKMQRQALELSEKVVGKEHPDTLNSMNNLALVLVNLGKYEEAEQMHRQTLELREKVLGKEHRETRRSRNNLAKCLGAKKRDGTAV